MQKIKFTALTAICYLYASAPAAACFVCTGDDDERAGAYRAMTAFMTLLPFIVVGSFLYWVKKRQHNSQ